MGRAEGTRYRVRGDPRPPSACLTSLPEHPCYCCSSNTCGFALILILVERVLSTEFFSKYCLRSYPYHQRPQLRRRPDPDVLAMPPPTKSRHGCRACKQKKVGMFVSHIAQIVDRGTDQMRRDETIVPEMPEIPHQMSRLRSSVRLVEETPGRIYRLSC